MLLFNDHCPSVRGAPTAADRMSISHAEGASGAVGNQYSRPLSGRRIDRRQGGSPSGFGGSAASRIRPPRQGAVTFWTRGTTASSSGGAESTAAERPARTGDEPNTPI